MKSGNEHRIVVSDRRRAQLFAVTTVGRDHRRAEARAGIDSRWEDYHQPRRPSPLDAPPPRGDVQHVAPGHSEREAFEERRRFARDVVTWLERETSGAAPTTVFAAPGFFGALRAEARRRGLALDLREASLTNVPADAIGEHPRVREAMNAAP